MVNALHFENSRPDVIVQVLELALINRLIILTLDLAYVFKIYRQLRPSHPAAHDHRVLAMVAHQLLNSCR